MILEEGKRRMGEGRRGAKERQKEDENKSKNKRAIIKQLHVKGWINS